MKNLTMENFDSALDIFMKYQEGINFPAPLIDMLRNALEKGNIIGCLTESKNSAPNGFGIIGKVSGQIHAIYVDRSDVELNEESIEKLESEIIEWCFSEIIQMPSRVEFPKMTDHLRTELLARGYAEYQRAGMSAERNDFLQNSEIPLPEGFVLQPYQPDMRDKTADVIAEANLNHIDAIIYPEYFSSKEKALEFLEKVEESAFGEFIDGASQVLMNEDRIIGFCLLVKKGENINIPDVGIFPSFQGRGLGKALLVNTISSFLISDDSVQRINLAVTLSNPAKFLYEKVGFRITEEFSAIIYDKKELKTK